MAMCIGLADDLSSLNCEGVFRDVVPAKSIFCFMHYKIFGVFLLLGLLGMEELLVLFCYMGCPVTAFLLLMLSLHGLVRRRSHVIATSVTQLRLALPRVILLWKSLPPRLLYM